MTKQSIYRSKIKRILDFIFALIAIIILAIPMAVLAIVVRTKLGSPVLFRQERPGKDETIFTLRKFRSMTNERDENGDFLPDEVRLTKFGRFLRATSLDELPELFNILKGEMSFVGPRPLHVRYLPLYNAAQRSRHTVRPGLTGHAQVNGRNAISWEERFHYDLEYIEMISFSTDLKIIAQTFINVIKQKDISAEGSVTMHAFQGTPEPVMAGGKGETE